MVEAMEARLLRARATFRSSSCADARRDRLTAPIGVEVIQKNHESMAPEEVGRRTADAMRAILREARENP